MQNTTILSFKDRQEMGKDYGGYTWEQLLYIYTLASKQPGRREFSTPRGDRAESSLGHSLSARDRAHRQLAESPSWLTQSIYRNEAEGSMVAVGEEHVCTGTGAK